MNNYDYPVGSDTEDAPWNTHDKESMKFDCVVTETLVRMTEVPTKDYKRYEESIDTDEVDWENEYNEYCITIRDLLFELREMTDKELNRLPARTGRGVFLKRIKKSCDEYLNGKIETYVNQDV